MLVTYHTPCHLSTYSAKMKTLVRHVNVSVKHVMNGITKILNVNEIAKLQRIFSHCFQ